MSELVNVCMYVCVCVYLLFSFKYSNYEDWAPFKQAQADSKSSRRCWRQFKQQQQQQEQKLTELTDWLSTFTI